MHFPESQTPHPPANCAGRVGQPVLLTQRAHSGEGFSTASLCQDDSQNFLIINLESLGRELASECGMKATKREIFDEHYRVLSVESQSLTIQGVRSGQVLTIVNQTPGVALTPADYPPGKLIALSDPANRPIN